MKPVPQSEHELFERATQIAGLSFAELAEEAGMEVPKTSNETKVGSGNF